MTLKELKQRAVNGRVIEKLVISLEQLVRMDQAALDLYADEQILGELAFGEDTGLVDVHYRIVGFQPGDGEGDITGETIIEVDADVSHYLEDTTEST